MKNIQRKYNPLLLMLCTCVWLVSCASIQITPIPHPSSTAKLRVLVVTASGPAPSGGWKTPAEKVEKRIFGYVDSILNEKGIYQVVSKEDVRLAMSSRRFSASTWKEDNGSLMKQLGRSVHAEYVMLFERGFRPQPYLYISLINMNSGERFEIHTVVKGRLASDFIPVIKTSYGKLFHAAKKDLLKTALEKGRRVSETVHKKKTKDLTRKKIRLDAEELYDSESPVRSGTAVYDFEAPAHMRVVALILSDALREELLMRNMVVVNRENLNQILKEIALGQTGLIRESQAIQAGKALSARRIILGRLGGIGKSLLLQAKMIDPESARTTGMATIRCKLGKEEDLLNDMPSMVEKLME